MNPSAIDFQPAGSTNAPGSSLNQPAGRLSSVNYGTSNPSSNQPTGRLPSANQETSDQNSNQPGGTLSPAIQETLENFNQPAGRSPNPPPINQNRNSTASNKSASRPQAKHPPPESTPMPSLDPKFPTTASRQISSNVNLNNASEEFYNTALNACRSTIAQQGVEIKKLKETQDIRNKRILQL